MGVFGMGVATTCEFDFRKLRFEVLFDSFMELKVMVN